MPYPDPQCWLVMANGGLLSADGTREEVTARVRDAMIQAPVPQAATVEADNGQTEVFAHHVLYVRDMG